VIDHHFGESSYSLRSLFRDEQRKVLGQILESTISGIEAVYRQQYEANYSLMRFLVDLGNPIPKALHTAAEIIVNTDLQSSLTNGQLDTERIRGLVELAGSCNLPLDNEGLGLLLRQTIETMMEQFANSPGEDGILGRLVEATELAHDMPFEVDLWNTQNLYYEMLHGAYPHFRSLAQQGDAAAQEWVGQFVALGECLSVKVE
jgi:hypothetical protein